LARVAEVAAGLLEWVEVGRRDEVGVQVGTDADLPAGVRVVDKSVVVAAKQNEIVQGGGASVGPRGDVVGVRPVKRFFCHIRTARSPPSGGVEHRA
jgi:hypothetical protein